MIKATKDKNPYLKKSNVIVRALTNECAGIITQRMFNFLIKTQQDQNWQNFDPKTGKIGFYLSDFCKYYGISDAQIYEKVKHKKKEMTVIEKEVDNLRSLAFYLKIQGETEQNSSFKFINLFQEGGCHKGYVEFKVNPSLIENHFISLKTNFTPIYLPYTKVVTSKYSLRLYEYLRSFLFFNDRSKKDPIWTHTWNLTHLAKVLNLSLDSSYFKYISILRKQILEVVKKDLAKTDIVFDYELIKNRRKYDKIKIISKLDFTKWTNNQNLALPGSKLIATSQNNNEPILNDDQEPFTWNFEFDSDDN